MAFFFVFRLIYTNFAPVLYNKVKMKIQIINGPNLNLLGQREPGIYGSESFDSYLPELRKQFPDVQIDYYQSNIEGELINKMQETGFFGDLRVYLFEEGKAFVAGERDGFLP